MLSRKNRFHGHGGVRRAYRQGRPVRNSLASMHVLRNDRVRASRVAVVVSRKVDKSAVVRNRIRRRVFALVRSELPSLKAPAELVITIYQPEAATMPADQLKDIVRELFEKARL